MCWLSKIVAVLVKDIRERFRFNIDIDIVIDTASNRTWDSPLTLHLLSFQLSGFVANEETSA